MKIALRSTWPKICKSCKISFYHPENNLCGSCYSDKERRESDEDLSIVVKKYLSIFASPILVLSLFSWLGLKLHSIDPNILPIAIFGFGIVLATLIFMVEIKNRLES